MDSLSIAALGVTGATGRHFVRQALDAGHRVTAVARRPDAVGLTHPQLKVIGATLHDPAPLAAAFRGADVIVSAVGVTSLLQARKGTTVYSQGTRTIRTAMSQAGVNRLVVVSSGGVEPQPNDNWFYVHVLKRFFLEPIYVDMRIMERELQESAVAYTIVRPPYLTGDEERTDYRISVDRQIDDDKTLSRWSLAHLLLRVAQSPAEFDRRKVWASF